MMPASQAATSRPPNWPERDGQAGDDLDYADEQHRGVRGARHQVVDPGGEVVLPVGQQVRELVEAERDRRDREDGARQEGPLGVIGADAEVRSSAGWSVGPWLWMLVMATPFL